MAVVPSAELAPTRSDARTNVGELLRAEGLAARTGSISRHMSVADVIDAFERGELHEAMAHAHKAPADRWHAPRS